MWHDSRVLEPRAGVLLVATPGLLDPHFYRTVVLLLQHDEEGTVGLVLNRETTERVGDHLPAWEGRAAHPGLIHYGGPVDPAVAIGLMLGEVGESTGVVGLGLVDLGDEPPIESGPPVRVYSGYSGWGAGQLDEELDTGSWFIVTAAAQDPFTEASRQWREVLRRQGGPLAVVSTFPDDPTLN
jgi:putative transcriptional regulator